MIGRDDGGQVVEHGVGAGSVGGQHDGVAAAKAPVPVFIAKQGGEPVDARSILSVIGLDARGGDTVVLSADGAGAEAVLDDLAAIVATDHDARGSQS